MSVVDEAVAVMEQAKQEIFRLRARNNELIQALKDVLINPAIQGTHQAARIQALINKAEGRD